MRIVIQTTHQFIINLIRNAQSIQPFQDLFKICLTFLIQIIRHLGNLLHDVQIMIDLTIQNTQWILLIATLAVCTHMVNIVFKMLLQSLTIGGTGCIIPKRIDQHLHIL